MNPVLVHPGVTPALQLEIEQFLYAEAALLDERRFDDWLALMTPDIEYTVPVAPPETDRGERVGDGPAQMHFEDDRVGLSIRLARLTSRAAWSEQPVPRTRRCVANVRIVEVGEGGRLGVRSNFLLYRYRHAPAYELLSGSRDDVLVRTEHGLRVRRRRVELDSRTLLGHLNLVL